MEIEVALKKFGLDKDEAAVYVASLQSGPSTISQIANQAKVKRTTAYLIARSLIEKGLLGQYKARNGLNVVAQPPEFLVSQLEERKKEISSILPQLKAIVKKEFFRPQVRYFEGKQGYFDVCEDTLQKHASEILWFGDPSEIYKVIGEKYDNEYYIPTRIKRNIRLRALLLKNSWSEKLKTQTNYSLLRQIEFLPNNCSLHSTKFIYQNKVAFISSIKELISVVVESKDLAEMERSQFELLWKLVVKS